MPALLNGHSLRGTAADRAIGASDGECICSGGSTGRTATRSYAPAASATADGQQSGSQRYEAEHWKPQLTPTRNEDNQSASEHNPAAAQLSQHGGPLPHVRGR